MNDEIFRKKSLEKIKSPESLNDCVRVVSPGIWMVFVAVIALLIGACVWGYFGRIETVIDTTAQVKDQVAVCYVQDVTSVPSDAVVRIQGNTYAIETVEYETGAVKAQTDLDDGIYEVKIVTESIRPFSFVFN